MKLVNSRIRDLTRNWFTSSGPNWLIDDAIYRSPQTGILRSPVCGNIIATVDNLVDPIIRELPSLLAASCVRSPGSIAAKQSRQRNPAPLPFAPWHDAQEFKNSASSGLKPWSSTCAMAAVACIKIVSKAAIINFFNFGVIVYPPVCVCKENCLMLLYRQIDYCQSACRIPLAPLAPAVREKLSYVSAYGSKYAI